jgi:hypothetical protein
VAKSFTRRMAFYRKEFCNLTNLKINGLKVLKVSIDYNHSTFKLHKSPVATLGWG